MIIEIAMNTDRQWSLIITDIDYDSWKMLIIAMNRCWSCMITYIIMSSWTLSWTLPERAILETCHLSDIWSEWWGDMTWPKNLPIYLPSKVSWPPSPSEEEHAGQEVGFPGPSLGVAPDLRGAWASLGSSTFVGLSTCAWPGPFTLLWSEGAGGKSCLLQKSITINAFFESEKTRSWSSVLQQIMVTTNIINIATGETSPAITSLTIIIFLTFITW